MNLKNAMLQCVVFDWDGTLVTTEPQIHEAYLRTMKLLKINSTWNRNDTHYQNGRSPADVFADKSIWGEMGDLAQDFFYKALQEVKNEKPDLFSLKDGAVELLSWFCHHPARPRIVILANKTQSILSLEVKQMQLLDMIDLIIGSNRDKVKDKPSPAAFERAVEGLFIDNRKMVIHIGDNPRVDPTFAHFYGATSILVADTPGADAANLTELLKKFEEM